MAKKTAAFCTEADLCAAFIAAIGDGWTAYAETAGYDIVLARNADGFQIGIQAKLKLNTFVLAQTVDQNRYCVDHAGPDCRAVLVPWGENGVGLSYLCAYVGITIIRVSAAPIPDFRSGGRQRPYDPELPSVGQEWAAYDWYEQAPIKRCKLPEYVPDVRAGTPSPLQLTEWKIGALKIAVLLESRGFVTRQDFRHIGIDHRRWIAPGTDWLLVRDGRYIPGPRIPDFKAQHPVVFEKVKADIEKWEKREIG